MVDLETIPRQHSTSTNGTSNIETDRDSLKSWLHKTAIETRCLPHLSMVERSNHGHSSGLEGKTISLPQTFLGGPLFLQ